MHSSTAVLERFLAFYSTKVLEDVADNEQKKTKDRVENGNFSQEP